MLYSYIPGHLCSQRISKPINDKPLRLKYILILYYDLFALFCLPRKDPPSVLKRKSKVLLSVLYDVTVQTRELT